jgi:hypothetical protein
MINIYPIYHARKPEAPQRESERDYLLRIARMRELEDRRANRRGILTRITRRRGRAS